MCFGGSFYRLSLGFFFVLILHTKLLALSIKFIGPCKKEPLLQKQVLLSSETTAGALSIKVLNSSQIDYKGSEEGFNSIFNTPTGLDALEVISDKEMNAYGWCYSVNDIEPALYPHEVKVNNNDQILWWYGYAHYKNGEWLNQCEPSYLRKAKQFCE